MNSAINDESGAADPKSKKPMKMNTNKKIMRWGGMADLGWFLVAVHPGLFHL